MTTTAATRTIRLSGGLTVRVRAYEGIPTADGFQVRHGITGEVVAQVATMEALRAEMARWNA